MPGGEFLLLLPRRCLILSPDFDRLDETDDSGLLSHDDPVVLSVDMVRILEMKSFSRLRFLLSQLVVIFDDIRFPREDVDETSSSLEDELKDEKSLVVLVSDSRIVASSWFLSEGEKPLSEEEFSFVELDEAAERVAQLGRACSPIAQRMAAIVVVVSSFWLMVDFLRF